MSSPPPTSPPPMVWPAPPGGNVVPFPLPWGATGCCPPGGMDALMKCYCDVQAATAFICSVMVQCIQTNPAVTAAIIAAIEASGSSLPLIGVTNGSDAQPGQVGEFVGFNIAVTYPTTSLTQIVTVGILQPGDWDCWASFGTIGGVNGIGYQMNPQPVGFSNAMPGQLTDSTTESAWVVGTPARALISVPTLMAFTVSTNILGTGPVGASGDFIVGCRRAR